MYKDICKLFLSPVNDFLSKLLNFFFEDKIRYSIFKNAPAFLLRDVHHAMHNILLLTLLKAKNKKVPHQRGETILFYYF